MHPSDRRCRYTDCVEQNPLAGDERVTCATCRVYLGLAPLDSEFVQIRRVDLEAMTDLLASAYATLEAITGEETAHNMRGLAAGSLRALRGWQRKGSPLLNE